MKHALVLFLALGIVLPALADDKKDTKEPTKLAAFQKLDYDKAIEKAKSDKKVVMIDFTATWCGWCTKLDNETFSQDKVSKMLKDKTIAIKVDTDKNPKLAKQYKVSGIPCIVFVDGDGKEVGRVVGFKPADKFLDEVTKIVK